MRVNPDALTVAASTLHDLGLNGQEIAVRATRDELVALRALAEEADSLLSEAAYRYPHRLPDEMVEEMKQLSHKLRALGDEAT